jgi:hypothetical protein
MIELPRAALVAGELAEVAEFFSFGTNDLTQTAFGFSRDDIGKFLGLYEERKLVPANPFVTIDQPGVGRLMRDRLQEGRQTRPACKLGICGETRRRPGLGAVLPQLGLTIVSCSPSGSPPPASPPARPPSASHHRPPSSRRMALRLRPVRRADLDNLERWSADPEARAPRLSGSRPDGQLPRRFEQDGLLAATRRGFHDMVVSGRLRGDRPSQV